MRGVGADRDKLRSLRSVARVSIVYSRMRTMKLDRWGSLARRRPGRPAQIRRCSVRILIASLPRGAIGVRLRARTCPDVTRSLTPHRMIRR